MGLGDTLAIFPAVVAGNGTLVGTLRADGTLRAPRGDALVARDVSVRSDGAVIGKDGGALGQMRPERPPLVEGRGAGDAGGLEGSGLAAFCRPFDVATRSVLLGKYDDPTRRARRGTARLCLAFMHGAAEETQEMVRRLIDACDAAAAAGLRVVRVVLVLMDGSKAELSSLLALAPHLLSAVPYKDSARRHALASRFHARSRRSPSAVLLDAKGCLVSGDALRPLHADPQGERLHLWDALLSEHARRCRRYLLGCENADLGCAAVLTREQVEQHLIRCPYKRLACPNKCGCDPLPENKMAEHKKVCPKRLVACPNRCGHKKLTASELAPPEGDGSHLRVCPLHVVSCPHGCGARMARVYMEAHEDVCPLRMVLCRFGCDLVPRRPLPPPPTEVIARDPPRAVAPRHTSSSRAAPSSPATSRDLARR